MDRLHRRRKREQRRRIAGRLLRLFGPSALACLSRTWRIEHHNPERLESAQDEHGVLIALWHGRMMLGMTSFAHRRWNVLVSPSGDGGLAKIMLDRLGYQVVRGSSSRGGARAVRGMLASLAEARSAREAVVVITPDGPRGPRHATNPGLAWLARETGCAIVPMGLVCDRAWHMSSWDDFTIPKPWARIVLAYGQPLRVPRETSDAALDDLMAEVARRMIALEHEAFEDLGRGFDLPPCGPA